jgi:acetylornithine/N-succinyldiaminopimelate aminotransferase
MNSARITIGSGLGSIQAAERKLLVNTYERNPCLFVSGQGVFLRDENGHDFLDLLSGIGVSALGYGHPAVERAIVEQSKKLIHTSNLFFHEHTAELALRLTEISGLDRVFFTNSGTEAWEAALKLTRAHAGLKAEPSARSFSPSTTAFMAAPWVRSPPRPRKNIASPSNP